MFFPLQVPGNNNKTEDSLDLQWQSSSGSLTNVKVENDGLYFIYLRVTLLNKNQGKNYTVSVSSLNIEGQIHASQSSTGFMGRGLMLSAQKEISVTCKPGVMINPKGTYLGIIKLWVCRVLSAYMVQNNTILCVCSLMLFAVLKTKGFIYLIGITSPQAQIWHKGFVLMNKTGWIYLSNDVIVWQVDKNVTFHDIEY